MPTYTYAMDIRFYLDVEANDEDEADDKAHEAEREAWYEGDNFDLDKDSIELVESEEDDDQEDDPESGEEVSTDEPL